MRELKVQIETPLGLNAWTRRSRRNQLNKCIRNRQIPIPLYGGIFGIDTTWGLACALTYFIAQLTINESGHFVLLWYNPFSYFYTRTYMKGLFVFPSVPSLFGPWVRWSILWWQQLYSRTRLFRSHRDLSILTAILKDCYNEIKYHWKGLIGT